MTKSEGGQLHYHRLLQILGGRVPIPLVIYAHDRTCTRDVRSFFA